MDMPENTLRSDLTAAFESLRNELSRCIIEKRASFSQSCQDYMGRQPQ